jgi:uncharacterized protein
MSENIMDQEKIKLEIKSVRASGPPDEVFGVILESVIKKRIFPIQIDSEAAKNLYLLLEKTAPNKRPKIHEVLNDLINSFGYKVAEIFIYSTYEQILISRIIMKKDDNEMDLEIRTTDALAIAIIANAPIFTTAKILAQSGMDLD